MGSLKKAAKAVKEAYQHALPGKGLDTKAVQVSHSVTDDGLVTIKLTGPEKDIDAAYASLFPESGFSLTPPDGVHIHSAAAEKSVTGDENSRTHHLNITHQLTTY